MTDTARQTAAASLMARLRSFISRTTWSGSVGEGSHPGSMHS